MQGFHPAGAAPHGYGGASSSLSTSVTSDLACSYAVRARIQADLACSYAVLSPGGSPSLTAVYADLACAYSVRAAVARDQAFAYGVRGRVSRDLACSYAVLADGSISRPVTVPASRIAKFTANPRVAVFDTPRPVALTKGPLDELWFVGNFSKDLMEAATTAVSVAPVSDGVAILEGPALQGALGLVKLGALSSASSNYFTFRVTCANGEVFDRTILLTAVDDRVWVFGKDPDDQRFYAFDFAADLALSANTSLASMGAPIVVGVNALSAPAIQGSQVVMKFGGLATATDAANSCGLPVTFANGEKLYRSIFFVREDH